MRLLDLQLERVAVATRLPFRFGRATMTSAPLLTARVTIEAEGGGRVEGASADLLVPKWFDKNPATSDDEDRAALVASAEAAGRAWRDAGSGTVFAQWWSVYREHVETVPLEAADRLVRGFGVALVERAVIDAACRAAEISFFEALRTNHFGLDPGAVRPSLAGWDPSAPFQSGPLAEIRLRHTVGMADELRAADVSDELRQGDDHPCSLEEDARAYGLDAFKLKVGGDEAADLERLDAIGQVLADVAPGALVTLDGNEQYDEPARLAAVLERLRERDGGPAILEHLAHVEQPVARAKSFDEGTREGLARLAAFAPVIIDEADLGLDAFPRALALGYQGVSVKNCKGVLRAVLNRGLCDVVEGQAFQAGEDLTNLPLLPLQQDLATAAALHLPHVERNGHHYFRGLDHLPESLQREALARHGDLYEARPDGGVRLAIDAGKIAVGSLAVPGYASTPHS